MLLKTIRLRRGSLCLLSLPTLLYMTMGSAPAVDATPPNIVIILADDMGSGDVQALNPQSSIPTPHLNGLATNGLTFTDAHTPSAVCTPTRYGLLTGRYCWRTRLKSGVLNGYGAPLMHPDRITIADFLKRHGYTTGIVGKWHLGLGFAKNGQSFDFAKPLDDGAHTHGFTSSLIIPASLDFPPYVFIRDGEITQFPSLQQPAVPFPAFLRKGERSPDFVMENVLDDIAQNSADFITNHRTDDSPFFLYVPLTGPHKPVLPHPRFRDTTELGPYGDFVSQVDSTVGQILKSIDNAKIRNNTLVFFTSDNGSFMRRNDNPSFVDHVTDAGVQEYRSDNHTANGIYRGTKADIWEAGHRVPFFVRWPGHVQAGTESDQTICLTDIFATVADVIQQTPPNESVQDSYSFLPVLSGKTTGRPPVIHHSANGTFAIRDGHWKLVLGNGSGGREQPKGKPFAKPYRLFNLSEDIQEQQDVIDLHPEVAKRLEKACLEIRDR